MDLSSPGPLCLLVSHSERGSDIVRDFITPAGKQHFSVSFRKPDWFTLKVLVAQSHLTLCNPMDCNLCPWNSPGKNTGVGCHSLLQGMFPTQELNLGLPRRRQILYHLRHQGSPNILQFVSDNLIGSPKQSAMMASVIIKWSFTTPHLDSRAKR